MVTSAMRPEIVGDEGDDDENVTTSVISYLLIWTGAGQGDDDANALFEYCHVLSHTVYMRISNSMLEERCCTNHTRHRLMIGSRLKVCDCGSWTRREV